MGKCKVAILLLWVFFVSCTTILELKVEARAASSFLEKEIVAKLKLLNKPAVKSIKSEDGDIIDCINIYKQPAFDHPALINHTIQRIPDFLLEYQSSNTRGASNASTDVFQTWQKSGSCPKETVPIRRIRKEDLLRAVSLDRFGQKPPEPSVSSTNNRKLNFSNLDYVNLENRSDAHLATLGFNFIGAQANINIWNPNVEQPEDFTTAQMWLKANNGENFASVEAGWMVNPKLYGDHNSRLFAAWTQDSYHTTGCFDLTCKGFVQIASEIALGSTVGPYSSQFNQQYEINVGIFWDRNGNWWLRVKDKIIVGYWPAEIVGNLQHSATLVQWGGQVFSYKVKTTPPHTGTQMGSGEEASGRFGFACYMTNVRIKDYSQTLKYPTFKDTYKSTGCFDLTCKGFVQTNKDIALGATLGPVSVPFHQQYEINVGIFRDNSGNWWLKVKNNIPVGYWPKELVGSLQSSASLVQWGGQVFSYEVKKTPHTGTQMGSGEEAYNKFGVACYMGGVRIKDNSQALKYPSFVSTHAIEPYCYSAFNDAPYGKDPVFYFGGAGRKPPHCP